MVGEKTIKTYGDVLLALRNMSPEELEQPAVVLRVDESAIHIRSMSAINEDIYCNKDDNEDGGTAEELKDLHGDEFEPENYIVCTPKGTVFFFDDSFHETEAEVKAATMGVVE